MIFITAVPLKTFFYFSIRIESDTWVTRKRCLFRMLKSCQHHLAPDTQKAKGRNALTVQGLIRILGKSIILIRDTVLTLSSRGRGMSNGRSNGALGHKGCIKMVEGDLAWEQQHLEGKRQYDGLIKYDAKRNQGSVPVHRCWMGWIKFTWLWCGE